MALPVKYTLGIFNRGSQMTMFKGVRSFIRVALLVSFLLTFFVLVHAGSSNPQPDDTFSNKDIIMILFGLLQTIFLGIGVWLIGNDREIFTRLRLVESRQETRDALCDERNENGEHYHNRAADKNPDLAFKQAVDTLRKLLYEGKVVIDGDN